MLVVLYACCTEQFPSDTARSCALVGSSCAVTVLTARPTTGPWSRLERTFILSQPLRVASYEGPWAVRDRGGRETTGQVVCMIVAGPGSLVGRFPLGNARRWTTTITEAAALSSDPDAHPPDRASERQPVDEERVLFGRWTRSSSSCRRRILSRSVRVQIPSK